MGPHEKTIIEWTTNQPTNRLATITNAIVLLPPGVSPARHVIMWPSRQTSTQKSSTYGSSSVWWWADARQIHIINIARLSHANVNPLFLRQVNQKWSHSDERFCIVNKSWAIRCPFRSIKFDNEIIDYYRFNTINEMCICDQCYVYGTKTFFLIANILWCITLSRYLFIRV
jgi:hypothetical protein